MTELKIGQYVKAIIHGEIVSGPDRSGEYLIRRTDVDPNVADGRSDAFWARPEELTKAHPAEPLGVGAVVRTADSQVWTRTVAGPAEGMRPWRNTQGGSAQWSALAEHGPEVLSPGVDLP